jgi:Galactose oxidase, central domain
MYGVQQLDDSIWRSRYVLTLLFIYNNLQFPVLTYFASIIVILMEDGTRHLSDTFLFDFETKTWSSLVAEGISPAPRDSHVSVVHGNSMFVFGGSSGRAMNDLYELQV